MRGVAGIALAILLLSSPGRAEEPLVAVDCLCLANEHGWVLGRSDQTPTEAGVESLMPRDAIIRLTTDGKGCAKYPNPCTSKFYAPVTGEVRTTYIGHGYMQVEGDFKLNIEGHAALPAGDEPVIPVDCLCLADDTGWVEARTDEPPGRYRLDLLSPYQSIIRLSAEKDGCRKHLIGCTADYFRPVTGVLRTSFGSYEYAAESKGFKLTIKGDAVPE